MTSRRDFLKTSVAVLCVGPSISTCPAAAWTDTPIPGWWSAQHPKTFKWMALVSASKYRSLDDVISKARQAGLGESKVWSIPKYSVKQ